jgi:ComF family protein
MTRLPKRTPVPSPCHLAVEEKPQKMAWKSLWPALGQTLRRQGWLGSRCRICHEWCSQAFCPACCQQFAGLVPRCARCALRTPPTPAGTPQAWACARCKDREWGLDGAFSAVDYGFGWDRLVADFKYRQQVQLAHPFAALMAEHHLPGMLALHTSGPPPVLMPIPLSPARLKERGYNQAWALCRALQAHVPWPAHGHNLVRMRHKAAQASLNAQKRLHNLADVFELSAPWCAQEHQTVILVDDVMTTGATALAAARTLQVAGVQRVFLWSFARTP